MTDEKFPDESIRESGVREVTEHAVHYTALAELVTPVVKAVLLAKSRCTAFIPLTYPNNRQAAARIVPIDQGSQSR
jgi:hypothetical protein